MGTKEVVDYARISYSLGSICCSLLEWNGGQHHFPCLNGYFLCDLLLYCESIFDSAFVKHAYKMTWLHSNCLGRFLSYPHLCTQFVTLENSVAVLFIYLLT